MNNLIKHSAILLLIGIALFTSCTSVKQIGKLNMISTRNIDASLSYVQLTTYSGGSKRELKKSKAKNVETAIDQTIKKVPGGEYMMNVKVYLINDKTFAVEGDVWGIAGVQTYRGFKIGDKVTWVVKKAFSAKKFYTGTITALKDDKTCYIKIESDTDNKTQEVSYDDITKVQ